MNSRLALFAVLLPLLFSQSASALTAGRDLGPDEGASVVRIDGPETYCSGAVISPTHILTAAHCVVPYLKAPEYWKTVSNYGIGVESYPALHERSKIIQQVKVELQSKLKPGDVRSQFSWDLIEATKLDTYIHQLSSNYKRHLRKVYFAASGDYLTKILPLLRAHDVAILELDQELPIPALPIADVAPDVRKAVVATGTKGVLLGGRIEVKYGAIGTDVSVSSVGAKRIRMIAFGGAKIQHGDSGSPVIALDSEKRPSIVGVISFYNPLRGQAQFEAARTDILKPWIDQVLAGKAEPTVVFQP